MIQTKLTLFFVQLLISYCLGHNDDLWHMNGVSKGLLHKDNDSERDFLVGAPKAKDPNKPEFKELAKESLQKFMTTSGSKQYYDVVGIQDASVQVVAGILTRLNFTVSPTDCQIERNGKPTSSNCPLVDPKDVVGCYSEIWEKSWENFKQIKVRCDVGNEHSRLKRQIPGGELEQNPNDSKYKELAEESKLKYLQEHEIKIPYKILSIEKATTQVVEGLETRIEFVMAPEYGNGQNIKCRSSIWEKPWQNFKSIKVECN